MTIVVVGGVQRSYVQIEVEAVWETLPRLMCIKEEKEEEEEPPSCVGIGE